MPVLKIKARPVHSPGTKTMCLRLSLLFCFGNLICIPFDWCKDIKQDRSVIVMYVVPPQICNQYMWNASDIDSDIGTLGMGVLVPYIVGIISHWATLGRVVAEYTTAI